MARSRKTRTPAAKGAPGRILKSACALGLGAALGILGFLVLFTFMADWNPPEGIQGGDDFSRLLADFDREFSAGGTAPEGLNRLLDRLEKRAAGVEPHLSVLKRRRNLARGAPPETAGAFKAAYLRGAERIAAA
ncbi:MAG: hypothetical protein LBD65_05390, partial [Spirochaetaceae bacterium]|nr:hypothetical protein [Spirochaetaceae bacterium]